LLVPKKKREARGLKGGSYQKDTTKQYKRTALRSMDSNKERKAAERAKGILEDYGYSPIWFWNKDGDEFLSLYRSNGMCALYKQVVGEVPVGLSFMSMVEGVCVAHWDEVDKMGRMMEMEEEEEWLGEGLPEDEDEENTHLPLISLQAAHLVQEYISSSNTPGRFVRDEFLVHVLNSKVKRKWIYASEVVKKSPSSLRATACRILGQGRPKEKGYKVMRKEQVCRSCGKKRKAHVCKGKAGTHVDGRVMDSFLFSSALSQ